jgi:hypothetical protein
MAINDDIFKEIEKKSEEYNGVAVLYKINELDSNLRQYYIISERIKKLLGQSIKIDRRLHVDSFIKTTESIDFVKEYSKEEYTFRAKEYNIWISSVFIKDIISVKDIIPDNLFEL